MNTTCTDLPADRHLRLPPSARYRVHCLAGLVWVTTGKDLRDHVLRAGESREFEGEALVVGALRDSRFAWGTGAEGTALPLPGWQARLSVFWRRFWFWPGNQF